MVKYLHSYQESVLMVHTTYIRTHLAICFSLFYVTIYFTFISSTQVSIYNIHTLVDSKAKYMQSFKGHPIYFDGACNLDIQTPNHKHLSFLEKYLVHSYLLYVSCYLFISFLLRISIDNYPYST